MKEKTKKKSSRGGGILLKKYGPSYFSEMAIKREKKRLKMKELWDKTYPKNKTKK